MSWQIGAGAGAIITIAYFGIAAVILGALWRSGQLRSNKLGTATGVIFFTCGVGHGIHVAHLLLPAVGIEREVGLAARRAVEWHLAVWDLLTAAVAVFYFSLRRIYGSLMSGAQLFEDLQEKQRQALQINDRIVQGLVVAQAALTYDQRERSEEALAQTLTAARDLISDLLVQSSEEKGLRPGDLVRADAASVR